jgi:hypothetical protein
MNVRSLAWLLIRHWLAGHGGRDVYVQLSRHHLGDYAYETFSRIEWTPTEIEADEDFVILHAEPVEET